MEPKPSSTNLFAAMAAKKDGEEKPNLFAAPPTTTKPAVDVKVDISTKIEKPSIMILINQI